MNGVEWMEIDRQMRDVARRRAALDAEELQLLREVKRAEVFKQLGYGSLIEYLERACGYAAATAYERVRVMEALEELPAMRLALRDGDVSFSAAKVLSRKVTADTEEDWLVALQGCTVREMEDALRGHVAGDLPGDPPDPAVETRTIKLELTPEAYAHYLEARRALVRETGGDISDADFMAAVCRRTEASDGPHHQIAITVCRDCRRGWQDAGTRSIELSAHAIERACCDAIELGNVDGDTPDRKRRTIPPAIHRTVLARDQHRCTIPGCRSSRFLDVHHIRWRSDGGTNSLSNLSTLCGSHHDAVHDGRLIISGTATSLVVTHADGRPYGTPRALPPSFPPPSPTLPTRHVATRPSSLSPPTRHVATRPPSPPPSPP
jgi:hypothetical protein